jgi:uncharacterized membrane protein HdeD (DUF308 family)
MSWLTAFLALVIILWIVMRTISFAVWNWRHENKTGSVMVMFLSIISAALPVYVVFFRE